MKKSYFFLVTIVSLISFSSCKVSKEYVQHISKKENIVAPKSKKVLVIATDKVNVYEFKKTFEKNFTDSKGFVKDYLNEFSDKLIFNNLFDDVLVDTKSSTYDALDKGNADYVILFSNIEIKNRIEWRSSGGMGMNGMGGMQTSTSVEYCIINVKVEVYDTKTDKEILDFVAIGEDSVFLFNFTKTMQETKIRSINHIINYLKSGKTTYDKY